MAQRFTIHPHNPQQRLILQAANILRQGGVVVYPTDSSYALACHIGDKDALDRITRIRDLSEKHQFTLMCRDVAEVSEYAKVDNVAFRLLKTHTPSATTFVLAAKGKVPRRLQHIKRKSIGVRIPDNNIVLAILAELGEPLLTTTLKMPGDELPLNDVDDIEEILGKRVDLIIDGGPCGFEVTTMIDLVDGAPELIRQGKADLSEIFD